MRAIRSFPPLKGNHPKVLVLGTMPGRVSLQRREYYAHRQNQFWRLVFGVFGKDPAANYQQKTLFVTSKKIALWDVLRECHRANTSADAAIKDELPNDIPGLLARYPTIRHIFFNGKQAEIFFKRYFNRKIVLERTCLPSSSPANARYTFEQKMKRWSVIRIMLGPEIPAVSANGCAGSMTPETVKFQPRYGRQQ